MPCEPEDPGDEREPVLLTIAGSRFECDAITALLESCQIPVRQGAAGGMRPYIDDNCIYVRPIDLATATELIHAPIEWPE